MKKLMFGCALLATALQGSLMAGNCCQENLFEGVYLGGNLGVLSHDAYRYDSGGVSTGIGDTRGCAFTAGVQLGYDWQCYSTVFGGVIDWNWTHADETASTTGPFNGPPASTKNEMNWFTTIRARAGLTVCQSLLYITGGAAVAKFDTTWNNAVGAGAGVVPSQFTHDETRWGWVGGLGGEFSLGCDWTLGAEVLGMHFCCKSYSRSGTVGSVATPFTSSFTESDTVWVGRILLNYRFGDLCCW